MNSKIFIICIIVAVLMACKEKKEDSLLVTPSELIFNAYVFSEKTLTVKTGAKDWNATASENWILTRKSDDKLMVSAKNNTETNSSRTGTITITDGLAEPVAVTITQSPVTMLSASPATLIFAANETTVQSVTITTNFIDWDYTCDVQWLTLEKTNNTLTVAINDINSGTAERTANIIITADDKKAAVQVATVSCIQLDPLQKVFMKESYFVENSDTAAVAKGETATFQFVLKSAYPIQNLKIEAGNMSNGNQQISATLKAFVGYIRAGKHASNTSKDAIYPDSDYYPDCLQELEFVDVPLMQNQPVWVSYYIPRNAESGDYSANLVFTGKINGESLKITKQVNTMVYPVTLPEQSLWVSNWHTTDGLSRMNNNHPVEPFSARYWELLTAIARVMRDHGQNTYLIWHDNIGRLFNVSNIGTQYSFDFTNFDKMVELFIREGGLKRIEGGHLGGRLSNDYWNFGVHVPNLGIKPMEDEAAQNFLSQLLPALHAHMKTKGWETMYVQHIADEPTDEGAQSYSRIADFVKKQMPGIKIIEALSAKQIVNIVDIWAPRLDFYHKNYAFYQELQAAGCEIWFYTCTEPQGNYANRFLELPLVQTRFLHWINYRYGATGYLHWGLNWWHLNTTNTAAVGNWPAGDAWIIYPAYGKAYSSIRLAAMRDGIADYELLKLLEQKYPDKARALAEATIIDFDSYNSNIRAFRMNRLELLKWLSE